MTARDVRRTARKLRRPTRPPMVTVEELVDVLREQPRSWFVTFVNERGRGFGRVVDVCYDGGCVFITLEGVERDDRVTR